MIDLIIHAGTKFALHQWLQARGLGDNVQDTDPESPTFGDYFYTHTDPTSDFIYWRHPSGKLEATKDVTDPENPVITFFNGYYGMLRYNTVEDLEAGIASWVRSSTAVSILEGFNGVGGEGVTLVTPEDLDNHLESIGVPGHEWLGGVQWSDARLWYLSPVMIGDERDWDGQTYRSLIDFNVWSPTTYPAGWELVEVVTPVLPERWVQGGGTGTAGSYNIGDLVVHDRPQDSGNDWVFQSAIPANTTEPSRDAQFDRWWTPISLASEYTP